VSNESYALKFIRPKKGLDLAAALAKRGKASKAKNEVEFLKVIFESGAILSKELKSKFTNGPYLVNKWVNKGVLENQTVPVHNPKGGANILPPPAPHVLHEHQRQALNQVRNHLDKGVFSSCLLYGITGSGKTEVYYRAVEHAIKSGRRAILIAQRYP